MATDVKGDLPDELSYVVGADVGVEKAAVDRVRCARTPLGRRAEALAAARSRRPVRRRRRSDDIAFSVGALNVVSGAFGTEGEHRRHACWSRSICSSS